jgi:hypothetical protein
MESVYYGGDNATASRSWRVNVDGPSGYLQTYVRAIDAQHPLSAAAQVGCVGTTDAAGNIGVRVLATEPGSTMLWWADAFPGTPSPVWTGLLAPPTIAALGYAGSSAGAIIGKPTITSRARGEYDLAVTGADGTAWLGHYTPATGWSGWQSLGGAATSGLSITTEGATSLQVFQRGTDGAVYVDTMTGSTWSGWSRLAGPTLAANTGPAAIGLGAGKTDVLVLGTDSKVYRLHYS